MIQLCPVMTAADKAAWKYNCVERYIVFSDELEQVYRSLSLCFLAFFRDPPALIVKRWLSLCLKLIFKLFCY